MPSPAIDRRSFLQLVAAATAASSLPATLALVADETTPVSKSAAEIPVVGIMGVNGRGSALAKAFMTAGAQVGYIADVDERAAAKGLELVKGQQQLAPTITDDFRRILDDKAIDILVVAAPNHWHAPAAIAGCNAGKHVYVEKPCSHNPHEGELAVAAARKAGRIVAMGSQRRSWTAIQEAIGKIHAGEIGPVHYARAWYNNRRPNIGHGVVETPPSWLNWKLWQGPAPERPFKNNLVHYNWHWHWHYGNGELGNNGVHALDVARWGLGVDFPIEVTSGGGKYRHDDDQETPDTHLVTFNFPQKKTVSWEGLSWSPLGSMANQFGVSFHGEEGSIVIVDAGYKVFDLKNKEIGAVAGEGGDVSHVVNFLKCTKSLELPPADILDGHKSTLLCHLGNIAHRVKRVLTTSEKDGSIVGDEKAAALWKREYREGMEPKVG